MSLQVCLQVWKGDFETRQVRRQLEKEAHVAVGAGLDQMLAGGGQFEILAHPLRQWGADEEERC